MAHVETKNLKLAQRALSILQEGAGVDRQTATRALKSSGNRVPVALIMLKTGLTSSEAVRKLNLHKGNVRQALAAR
jgi:N-acetylmuramic acid 6-phosphate etherase